MVLSDSAPTIQYDYDGTFSNETEYEFNLGYHIGFGMEFPLNSNAALNFDYRQVFLNSDTNEQNFNSEYSGNTFTAGLMFYL
jgi:opacity protein-like surface antigen